MIPGLELLGRLRDAHAPPAPSWWPPAPGWWIVLVLAAALAVIVLRYAPGWWRRLRLRRRLMAALEAAASVAEVSQLLRRAALERYPEQQAGGLHGADWIAFLEGSARTPGRFAALSETLTETPYRGPPHADAPGELTRLRNAARGWLREVL